MDRFAPPSDAPLSRCAHCNTPVETLFARGRCDDCASDPLLVALDEVSRVDVAVALDLGARSFVRRSAAHDPREGCGCDLCDTALDDLDLWHDDRRTVFLADVDGGPLPWELAWSPDLALPAANDTADAGEAA